MMVGEKLNGENKIDQQTLGTILHHQQYKIFHQQYKIFVVKQ
jgi:hypothetical protein